MERAPHRNCCVPPQHGLVGPRPEAVVRDFDWNGLLMSEPMRLVSNKGHRLAFA
jgi:hypothetical protein